VEKMTNSPIQWRTLSLTKRKRFDRTDNSKIFCVPRRMKSMDHACCLCVMASSIRKLQLQQQACGVHAPCTCNTKLPHQHVCRRHVRRSESQSTTDKEQHSKPSNRAHELNSKHVSMVCKPHVRQHHELMETNPIAQGLSRKANHYGTFSHPPICIASAPGNCCRRTALMNTPNLRNTCFKKNKTQHLCACCFQNAAPLETKQGTPQVQCTH
jgi:hypothetical protein